MSDYDGYYYSNDNENECDKTAATIIITSDDDDDDIENNAYLHELIQNQQAVIKSQNFRLLKLEQLVHQMMKKINTK